MLLSVEWDRKMYLKADGQLTALLCSFKIRLFKASGSSFLKENPTLRRMTSKSSILFSSSFSAILSSTSYISDALKICDKKEINNDFG